MSSETLRISNDVEPFISISLDAQTCPKFKFEAKQFIFHEHINKLIKLITHQHI
jgi:hypothetical protein